MTEEGKIKYQKEKNQFLKKCSSEGMGYEVKDNAKKKPETKEQKKEPAKPKPEKSRFQKKGNKKKLKR